MFYWLGEGVDDFEVKCYGIGLDFWNWFGVVVFIMLRLGRRKGKRMIDDKSIYIVVVFFYVFVLLGVVERWFFSVIFGKGWIVVSNCIVFLLFMILCYVRENLCED